MALQQNPLLRELTGIALLSMEKDNVPMAVQAMLVGGDADQQVPPGVLARAIREALKRFGVIVPFEIGRRDPAAIEGKEEKSDVSGREESR
jgi:hypothetical protein